MVAADLSHFNFTTEVRVRLPETDAIGVVYHGFFFTYFEVGRVDYLRNLDMVDGSRPIKDFDNLVVSAHIDCKAPARLDDPLQIHVRISEIKNSSFTFEFAVTHKEEGHLIATGYSVHCAVGEDLKPIPVPEGFRNKIEGFEN